MTEHNAEIYKKAFEIAVRCARELNGMPELKEAYQEASKDNRALQSFMDFCLEKAAEETPEHTAVDVVPMVLCGQCRKLLAQQPTAEVAPVVHGQWLSYLDGDHIEPEVYFLCSKCGSRGHRLRWHYCPNCGAKMDGGKNCGH